MRDPDARALLLFPTKALARDQVESLRRLVAPLQATARIGVSTYDGDTPPDVRRAARRRAHIIATNPDMLHRGWLPRHDRSGAFWAGLRYVVLDELHVYRGVFGSHVANVLRRLWRVCRYYGSRPQIIACSATIANPRELFTMLTGRPSVHAIERSDAPQGPRTTLVVNPKVVDPSTGVRRDYLKVAHRVASVLRRADLQTLAFCRTRKAVELLTRYAKEDAMAVSGAATVPTKGAQPPASGPVRGYRGGYLPERRREVENALRDGSARFVVTTNALELGIDIGGVDAVVMAGYPGTRAAFWQRAGRAGRRGRGALGVLCLSSLPRDQFIALDPKFLGDRAVEHARVDPDNPEIVLPHLRCAAAELPWRPGETFDGLSPDDVRAGLSYLVEQGALHEHDGVVVMVGDGQPAEAVDLRGTLEENFSVVEAQSGAILAEVDFEDGPLYLHPGAIYAIEGQTFEVLRLEWDMRKAFVRSVSADYYTEAIDHTRVRLLELHPHACDASGTGEAQVLRTVPGFKKIRFRTHENIGFGPIRLPDLELHTTAAYWRVPHGLQASATERAAVALACAHGLRHVAAMTLMCDAGDLGCGVMTGHPSAWGTVLDGRSPPPDEATTAGLGSPHVVLFDRAAGGCGLATAAHELAATLFRHAAELVGACGCSCGCPTCLGAASGEAWSAPREAVIQAFELLARTHEERASSTASQSFF